MVNEDDKLIQLIGKLRQQKSDLLKEISVVDGQIQVVEQTLNLLNKAFPTEQPQIYSNSASEIQGMTELKAMIHIASKNDGQIIMKKAKPILLEAKILKNPKTALASMYSNVKRSGKFELVAKGVYKLISQEQTKF
jgi:hypothetical protein